MKKVLITGVSGFVGSYLVEELIKNGDYQIYGTKLASEKSTIKNIINMDLDLTNKEQVYNILSSIKPDIIFHLAAQSSVKLSWENPLLTAEVNILGTINLLEEIKKINSNCRILLVGSSEEYGKAFDESSFPKEEEKCRPQNIYAITKLTQNYLGELYAKSYNMPIVMTRSFNHFGPRQSTQFVVADFCNQVARIECGLQEPIIKVGNLSACRDFSNVKDIVSAYHLLVLNGKSGETYNIGSGSCIKIEDILKKIISYSTTSIEIQIDENKFRPIEIVETKADITKLSKDVKWNPTCFIDNALKETLEYYRSLYFNDETKLEKKRDL